MSPRQLTQKVFAELLSDAMEVLGVKGVDLHESTHIDQRTISRYRDPEYEGGPPVPKRRRALEKGLGVPEGYLDGIVELDLVQFRRMRDQPATRVVMEGDFRKELQQVKEQLRARGAGDQLDSVLGVQLSQIERYFERNKSLSPLEALDMLHFLWEAGVKAKAHAETLHKPQAAAER